MENTADRSFPVPRSRFQYPDNVLSHATRMRLIHKDLENRKENRHSKQELIVQFSMSHDMNLSPSLYVFSHAMKVINCLPSGCVRAD